MGEVLDPGISFCWGADSIGPKAWEAQLGQHHSAYALGLLLALTGAAGAQEPEKMPLGWFLEEFESAGLTDIYLYWLDPAAGGPLLQVSCQEKWPDVVVSAYMDVPENEPKSVELVDGDARQGLDFVSSGTVDGRYSAGGVTQFTPEVMDILSGQFSVEVDGVEQGRYSTKGAADMFGRLFEACPVDGDGT